MKRSLALIAVAGILLTGCSSAAEPEVAPSVAPSPSETAAKADSKDVTAELKKLAGANAEAITSAEETEPGRISVETTLVDPRTDGSPEAEEATAICEAATELDGVTYVSVLEEDGTSWVLYGHPAVPKGECAEV